MVAYHDAVPMKKSILVADHADVRLSAVLAGHELSFVSTLDEAKRVLAGRNFDLVAIGVHFDESRMFDFLRHLQASGKHASVPVVCTRSYRFVSPAISIEGLEIAVRALGCRLFLDLTKYPDDAH